MVLTAFVLFTLAVVVCATGTYYAFRALRLGVVETLLWLGVLERPTPRTSRRRRAAPASPTAAQAA